MGKIKKHEPVKYFCALSFQNSEELTLVLPELEKIFGPIDSKSSTFIVDDFTIYYQTEMGNDLSKCMVSFEKLNDVEKLAEFKIKTNDLEEQYSKNNKRSINLDPGYLTMAKVVLATTKDYSHRLYLKDGIFGDLHLVYAKNSYQPQPWTYPDYQQPQIIKFFLQMREALKKRLSK